MTEQGELAGGRGRRDWQEKEIAEIKMVRVVLQVLQPEYQLVAVAVRRARKKPNRETGIAHSRQTGRNRNVWPILIVCSHSCDTQSIPNI